MIKQFFNEIFGDYSQVAVSVITVALFATTILAIFALIELATGTNGLSSAADVITATLTIFIAVANLGLLRFAHITRDAVFKEKLVDECKTAVKSLANFEDISRRMYEAYAEKLTTLHMDEKKRAYWRSLGMDEDSLPPSTHYLPNQFLDNFETDCSKEYQVIIENVSVLESVEIIVGPEISSVKGDIADLYRQIITDNILMKRMFDSIGKESGGIKMIKVSKTNAKDKEKEEERFYSGLFDVDSSECLDDVPEEKMKPIYTVKSFEDNKFGEDISPEYELLDRFIKFAEQNKATNIERKNLSKFENFYFKDDTVLETRFKEINRKICNSVFS
ncbi:hypothetical protein [Pseudoalteromonas umbrosa]|uniref:hypothetical protein n=1 Tax=Pseudoalteromonas umbrosa TaxID=3048489 RepID=UPI0024C382B0|nr:hypothetical protein [Pseudoalteromonas sp. B95]MDK1289824.1 hypothetical protein [Pseudoalteromonas sp. B95]